MASKSLSYQSLIVWQNPVKKGPDKIMHVAALAKSSAPSAKVPEMKGGKATFVDHRFTARFLLLEEGEVRRDPSTTASRLQAFLGLPTPVPASAIAAAAANASSAPVVGDSVRRLLQRFYAEYNHQVRPLYTQLAGTVPDASGAKMVPSTGWESAPWLAPPPRPPAT